MWKNTLTIKQNSIWELQQELNNLEYIEIHLKRNPTENSIQKKKKKKITSLESRVEEADSGSILLRNPVKPPKTRNPNPKIYKLKGSRN